MLPANNPLLAFILNPDFDSPLARMLFQVPDAFVKGLVYAWIVRYIIEHQQFELPPGFERLEDFALAVADWAASPTGRCVTGASAAAVAIAGRAELRNPAACGAAPVLVTRAFTGCVSGG